MSWADELVPIAKWALMSEDLRHRYIYARTGTELAETPGVARALETTIVLSIYAAALGKGFIAEETVDHERPYPGPDGQNKKRADLAFKDEGPGQNWAYVEVKHYGWPGAADVRSDVDKLREISQKSQRWILVYRVRRSDTHANPLGTLLEENFGKELPVYDQDSFLSVPQWHDEEGLCEVCLARVW